MSKVVFVGNVPYNMGEEQLIDVFKSVGQVVGFRLVFDRETGKPKGYGFCEFSDHETAASAVRNLDSVDVGGRPLRIDLADSDPFLEGKTTVRGELVDGGVPGPAEQRTWSGTGRGGGRSSETDTFLASLPPGIKLPLGTTSADAISHHLATMAPNQLMEVLAQMKAFVITHSEQARKLLVAHPQLAYALFQALLLNQIVDPMILQRMLAATSAAPPPVQQLPQPAFAPPMQQFPPPQNGIPSAPTPSIPMYHQQQQFVPPPQPPSYYRPPPPPQLQPPPQLAPPPQQASAPSQSQDNINEHQRAMLMQVLAMSPDQIGALPEGERAAIQQLRAQFLGTAA
ncbi:uncharacterized protein BT62DRAFT_935636 [Guyanagaster necrorhizus]|uniref:RRM domain-containing protein n=1 Tax=Guyanagaster necrorhizus TaxID=856835 RepID=A0A9P8APG1_9AGAR|nr:uncharacterized protein BT62DRAFT_935636 [Guyanagaster necrorhizus MCA 3950]KAG7442910.1 hypothetical protein BT62DRAFT_935636 [Guyanagaster necrorhizus MCA 3950]